MAQLTMIAIEPCAEMTVFLTVLIIQFTHEGRTSPMLTSGQKSYYTIHYRCSDGYWMPYGIEIQGTEMPVSISMEIRKWSVDVALPDHLFVVN